MIFPLFSRWNKSVRPMACLLVLLGLVGIVACHVTPYQRTLPEWVRNVYVPLAVNETYEPGLEELITNCLTEEMLADGRLTPVQRKQADVLLKVVLERYTEATSNFEGDDVESSRALTVDISLLLYDPNDTDVPIATVARFPVTVRALLDYRAVDAEQLPDAKGRLGHEAGRAIVRALLTNAKMASGR